ncbi:MAG: hemolysin family protein [Phycisphaerales bacterium JB059]
MSATWWFVIGLAALIASSVLASARQSLQRMSRARFESLAERSGREGVVKRAGQILADVDGHAAALAMPRVLCSLSMALASVMWIGALRDTQAHGWVEVGLGLGLGMILIWIFSVVLPVAVGEHAGERVALLGSRSIRAWYAVMAPARGVARFLDEVVRRLVGGESLDEHEEIEAELLSAVEEGERGGRLDEVERDMIEAVVEFRSTTAEQVMTPRTEIEAIAYTDDLLEVERAIEEIGHSRVPVYEENLDNVVGVLYAKDLLRWIINHASNGRPFILREILRDATFVPETKTVRELLSELLAAKVHIAMVADEYGGTAGLVTIEDIVEEVFGEIQDEYEDDEDVAAVEVGKTAATIDARAHIDDTNDELETLGLELPESDEYDTVGGFVVCTLGRIPEAGERFEHAGAMVTVLEAEPTRVVRVRVEPVLEDAPEGEG